MPIVLRPASTTPVKRYSAYVSLYPRKQVEILGVTQHAMNLSKDPQRVENNKARTCSSNNTIHQPKVVLLRSYYLAKSTSKIVPPKTSDVTDAGY